MCACVHKHTENNYDKTLTNRVNLSEKVYVVLIVFFFNFSVGLKIFKILNDSVFINEWKFSG